MIVEWRIRLRKASYPLARPFELISRTRMMKRTIPVLLSLLSGAIWAVIAYVVAYSMIGRAGMSSQVGRRLIVGMIAAPIIGAVIGGGSRGFARLGRTGRIALALVDLYFAAFLFLWAARSRDLPPIETETPRSTDLQVPTR